MIILDGAVLLGLAALITSVSALIWSVRRKACPRTGPAMTRAPRTVAQDRRPRIRRRIQSTVEAAAVHTSMSRPNAIQRI